MTKIITCSELRYLTLAELEVLSRMLQVKLWRIALGSHERAIVLASLESVRRAMAHGNRSRERERLILAWKQAPYRGFIVSGGRTLGQV
jgi:hypothetical protein